MAFACFLYIHTTYKLYKMYANINRINMQLPMYVFCIYKNPKFFIFQIFASITTPSSVLICNFKKFQDQYFHIQKDSFILYIYLVLI